MPNTWIRGSSHQPPEPRCQWCGGAIDLGAVDCVCSECLEDAARPDEEVRFDEYE